MTNSALWLMMGLFSLLLEEEEEGRKEEDREPVQRAGSRPRPRAATLSHRCGRNYLSERERKVEDLGSRTGQWRRGREGR